MKLFSYVIFFSPYSHSNFHFFFLLKGTLSAVFVVLGYVFISFFLKYSSTFKSIFLKDV